MSDQLKKIKDVFPDFETEDALLQAKIENVNLYKKANKLALTIVPEERMNLKNICLLENYLKSRFSVTDVEIIIDTKIEYSIETEWNNIVNYINAKYPLTKAILMNNKPIIQDKKMIVNLAVKGKDFLNARGFDKIAETAILNFLRKEYKVEYEEKIDEELVKKYEENTRRIERMAIELAEQEIVTELNKSNKISVGADASVRPQDDKNKAEKTDVSASTNNNKSVGEIGSNDPKEPEETTPLILGRSLTIKENIVKVEDIGIDSGKIALEGEIINMDSRELKSRKIFSVI